MRSAISLAATPRPFSIARLVRSRLLIGAATLGAIAATAAWHWSWLVAIGVAPWLISAAPCAAMCGLGLCMHRMGGRSCVATDARTPATQAGPGRAAEQRVAEAPACRAVDAELTLAGREGCTSRRSPWATAPWPQAHAPECGHTRYGSEARRDDQLAAHRVSSALPARKHDSASAIGRRGNRMDRRRTRPRG